MEITTETVVVVVGEETTTTTTTPSKDAAGADDPPVEAPNPPTTTAPPLAELFEAATTGDRTALERSLPAFREAIASVVVGEDDLRDRKGSTPLHYAAGNGHLGVCRTLLEEAAAAASSMPSSSSSMSSSTGSDDDGSVAATATARWFADLPDRVNGRRALHWAARNGRLETCRLLVAGFGADPGPLARGGVTPLQLAVWRGHVEVCLWLSSRNDGDRNNNNKNGNSSKRFVNGWGCTVHHWLAKSPIYAEERRALLERRRQRQRQHDGELTNPAAAADAAAATAATAESDPEPSGAEARLLALCEWLDDDEDDHWTKPNDHGQTPLHKAGFGGNLPVLRFLLTSKGVSDDRRDAQMNTAADCAERNREWEAARYLRRHGNPSCLRRARSVLFPTRGERGGDEGRNGPPPSLGDVRSAYLRLAREHHPDRRRRRRRGSVVVVGGRRRRTASANDDDDDERWREVRESYRLWTTWWTDPEEADAMIRVRERHGFLQRTLPPLLLWHRSWHDDDDRDRSERRESPPGRRRGGGVGSNRDRAGTTKKASKSIAAAAAVFTSPEARRALEDFERRLVRLLRTLPHRGLPLSKLPKEYRKAFRDAPVVRPRDYRCKKLGFLLRRYCHRTVEVVDVPAVVVVREKEDEEGPPPREEGKKKNEEAAAAAATGGTKSVPWVRLREDGDGKEGDDDAAVS